MNQADRITPVRVRALPVFIIRTVMNYPAARSGVSIKNRVFSDRRKRW